MRRRDEAPALSAPIPSKTCPALAPLRTMVMGAWLAEGSTAPNGIRAAQETRMESRLRERRRMGPFSLSSLFSVGHPFRVVNIGNHRTSPRCYMADKRLINKHIFREARDTIDCN